jgi:hypothetical protein
MFEDFRNRMRERMNERAEGHIAPGLCSRRRAAPPARRRDRPLSPAPWR